jgi:hypothetical protein
VPALAERVKMHPICTASRTTLNNMFFFLLALIIVAIAVAISIFRHNISLGSGIGREDSCIASERAGQSRISGSMKKFLVVVLPDGTIVTPRVAE